MNSVMTRVLLVEDEEDAREILEFYLKKLFDEVIVATDGEEGYNICVYKNTQDIYFDIIITDIRMPNKDGLTMIEDITKFLPDQKYIIISAHKDEEYLFRSIGLNILSYFVKPLTMEKVLKTLEELKSKITSTKQKVKNNELIRLNDTYSYNKQNFTLYEGIKSIKISKKESSLLDILIHNIGNIMTNDDLKKHIWDNVTVSDATLRTLIKRLKDKVSKDDFVVSRKGYGYIIERI